MEVSVMGAKGKVTLAEIFPTRSRMVRFGLRGRRTRVGLPAKGRIGFDLDVGRKLRRAASLTRVAVVRSEMVGGVERRVTKSRRSAVVHRPQLFVGLPLDAVSECNTVNHAKAIAAGLKALKLLGADGVELPVWWGVVEKEAMGKYRWSGYIDLVKMIQKEGLKVRVSLYFHASKIPAIPLPSWVSSVGDAEPDIYFTDKEGKRHKECLSLAVDDLPVLGGKSPMQVYENFYRSFQATFTDLMGSTITDISIGLGPDGELKYPSLRPVKNQQALGAGEFQCYDKHMLNNLKKLADETGNHYWGLSGPHDAPRYDQSPHSGNFFKENGGSWETPYGNFFLAWYSEQLLYHGDRLLSIASAVFGTCPVTLSGKVPFMHSWYKTRSHPSELTAGYYNTDKRDGYDATAEIFGRNSCRMILTGMDLSDEIQPPALRSSPESLLLQIKSTCKKHGVRISGENSSTPGVSDVFAKIKENILARKPLVDSFTYQRMGAAFFSPEHWPKFTDFVRSISQPELHVDDLPSDDEGSISLRTDTMIGNSRQMQAV